MVLLLCIFSCPGWLIVYEEISNLFQRGNVTVFTWVFHLSLSPGSFGTGLLEPRAKCNKRTKASFPLSTAPAAKDERSAVTAAIHWTCSFLCRCFGRTDRDDLFHIITFCTCSILKTASRKYISLWHTGAIQTQLGAWWDEWGCSKNISLGQCVHLKWMSSFQHVRCLK